MHKNEVNIVGKVPAQICLESESLPGIDTAPCSSLIGFFPLLKLETQDLSSLDDCFISSSKR